MSVRQWQLKLSEVKALDREALLLLALRSALRVEPWRPRGAKAPWDAVFELVVHAARDAATLRRPSHVKVYRALSDAGATVANATDGTDKEMEGRCHNYATSTLVLALTAAEHEERRRVWADVLWSLGSAASIPALRAHAGRVKAPRGKDPVAHACGIAWDAIRADVKLLAEKAPQVLAARSTTAALRKLGPLWPGDVPEWASP